mgnify:CR=1 FL=1
MLTLYTAVGTLKFQKTTGGKSIPLVINDGQEYGCLLYTSDAADD